MSNHITWNLSKSVFHIRISTKKQALDFSKRNSYTNTCLKFLCDAKLITSLLIFLISSKKLKAAYLSFHWFNDFRTHEFELVTREFELVTRGFELVLLSYQLVLLSFQLVTRNLCFTMSLYFLAQTLIKTKLKIFIYEFLPNNSKLKVN